MIKITQKNFANFQSDLNALQEWSWLLHPGGAVKHGVGWNIEKKAKKECQNNLYKQNVTLFKFQNTHTQEVIPTFEY